jgi:hypothetical protein
MALYGAENWKLRKEIKNILKVPKFGEGDGRRIIKEGSLG